jgi:hypothetical protein
MLSAWQIGAELFFGIQLGAEWQMTRGPMTKPVESTWIRRQVLTDCKLIIASVLSVDRIWVIDLKGHKLSIVKHQ